jgi:hypothetical protein
MILHTPLCYDSFPANTQLYFMIFIKLSNFDIFPTDNLTGYLFVFDNNTE